MPARNTAHNELPINSTNITPSRYPRQHRWRSYDGTDTAAVEAVKARYGVRSEEDAVRLALRLAAGDAIKVAVAAGPAKKVVAAFRRTTLTKL